MKTINIEFNNDEIVKLKQYRDKQKDSRLKMRFVALLMIAQSIHQKIVALVVGKSIASIERWLKIYQEKGVDGLSCFHYSTKNSYLSDNDVSSVIDWVKNTNPTTIKEVRQYIRDNFNIKYSHEAVRKLLKKNGLKFMRPKMVPGNPPSEEEQKRQVEKYFNLKNSCEPGTIFLFGDAMHLMALIILSATAPLKQL